MGVGRLSGFAFAILFGLGLPAPRAKAGTSDRAPLRIDYRAPAACPSATEFERLVHERVQAQDASVPSTTLSVVLTVEGEHTLARLAFVTADGTPVERRVEAGTCAQAVDAIALVTALAIDAWVEERAREERAAAVEASGNPQPAATQAPTARTPAATAPREPPPPPEPKPAPLPPRLGPELRSSVLEVGVGFVAQSPHGPQASLGGAAFFGWRNQGAWRYALRLGFGYESTTNLPIRDGMTSLGQARFDWLGARGQLCPYFFQPAEPIVLEVCAGLELGAILVSAVTGSGLDSVAADPALWAAAAGIGRLQFAATEQLRFETDVGAVVPFHSDETGRRFVVRCSGTCSDSEVEVFRVPVIGWSAGIAVALAFP